MKNKIPIILLLIVFISAACKTNDSGPYATSTAYFYPTVSIVEKTPVAFYTESDFDCWRAPGNWRSTANYQDEVFLLVSALTPGNWERLYQYIPSTNTYQLEAISLLRTKSAYQETTSPMRNAFWFISQWTGSNYYYIYTPSRNLISQIPAFSTEIWGKYTQWSPDGTCLFFSLPSPVAYRLADGKLQEKSIPGFEVNFDLDISPNAQWWSWGNDHGITVVALDGKEWVSEAFQTQNPGHFPRWSPDGQHLAFDYSINNEKSNIRIVKFGTQGEADYWDIHLKYGSIAEMEWSNNNRSILISDGSWMGIYDVSQQKWTHEIPYTKGHHCFSANGEKLYYITYEKVQNDDPLYSGRTEVDRLYALDLTTNLTTALSLPEEYLETDPPYLWGLYCTARP